MDPMEEETKTYEASYLLKDLGEEELAEAVQKMRKMIEDEDGLVVHENRPQKQILAYPIKKKLTANFGSFSFIFPSNRIPALQKSFEKMNLLRLLISHKKPEKKPTKRLLKRRIIRQEKEFPAVSGGEEEIQVAGKGVREERLKQYKEPASTPASTLGGRGESLQVEEIDKKLEEILGE
jgi:ribosomal protein S6